MKLNLVEPRVTTFAKLPRFFLVLEIKEEADMPACMVLDLLVEWTRTLLANGDADPETLYFHLEMNAESI